MLVLFGMRKNNFGVMTKDVITGVRVCTQQEEIKRQEQEKNLKKANGQLTLFQLRDKNSAKKD